ncbi:MAG: hypothetical protein J6T31_05325 [Methanobrevibacter sp.]|nr:hypothetical protein [Methanobrevibacter sp.]
MTTYTIEYDLSELKNLADKFATTVQNAPEAALPNTANAFQKAARYVRNIWTNYLSGDQPLNGIEFMDGVTSAMVRSIRAQRNGDFDYTVFSDNRQLEEKTKGRKEVEYDMKQTHPYGKKSRVSKKGIPYLIIPFRWGTPNQKGTKRAHFNNFIPQKSYNTAVKGLKMSGVDAAKKYFEANFKGENIERQGYNWAKNGRLKEDQAWDDRSVGMVRMRDITGSSYFTFRIVSAKSPANSWIYHKDAKPGIDMMGALERTVKPKIDQMISAGIQADNDMYSNQ